MHTESHHILKHLKQHGSINISTTFTATCWYITDFACSLHVCELHVSEQGAK